MKRPILCLIMALGMLIMITSCSSGFDNNQREMTGCQEHSDYQYDKSLIDSLAFQNIETIIDVGCGTGNSIKALEQHFPKAHITGIDTNPNMVEKAKDVFSGNSNVSIQQGDAVSFHVNAPADLIFSGYVIHRIPTTDQINVLRNLYNNLKPGGKLVVVFNPHRGTRTFQDCLHSLVTTPSYSKQLKNFHQPYFSYTVDQYRAMLEHTGFFVNEINYKYHETIYPNSEALKSWIQQWLSCAKYLAEKSTVIHDHFMDSLVQSFIKASGQELKTSVIWGEYLVTVIAHKT